MLSPAHVAGLDALQRGFEPVAGRLLDHGIGSFAPGLLRPAGRRVITKASAAP